MGLAGARAGWLRAALPGVTLVLGCGADAPAAPDPWDVFGADAASWTFPAEAAGFGPGRGFPEGAPWLSYYGWPPAPVEQAGMAARFRILAIDADPSLGGFDRAEIERLRKGGVNRVLSYLNLGACETFRSYFTIVPPGMLSCGANRRAQRGPSARYRDEVWMDPADPEYQKLILRYVAPRLLATGVDGLYVDKLEILEHGPADANGPCDDHCRQGGLELMRALRAAFPNILLVMQNATSDVTRDAKVGSDGTPFASLLDGVSHEGVFAPRDQQAENELIAWKGMELRPGGRPFWIGTVDYVGTCSASAQAAKVYAASRARGFSPYASDRRWSQRVICYWPF